MTPGFWQRIEESKNEEGDRARQAAALTDGLAGEGVDAVLEFSRDFDAAMDHLYSWELWGAAYLAMGGCGDDMFEYLRAWLIADGQSTALLAGHVPEVAMLALLGETGDPDLRWGELGVHAGEHILYAAGIAHERLTGEWVPSSSQHRATEPAGTPWEESDLPHLYPDLVGAQPDDWWGEPTEPSPTAEVLHVARRGIGAFSEGDHAAAIDLLEPLLEDAAKWAVLADLGPDWRTDVAYAVGITRMLRGDVDASAKALRLVRDDLDGYPHIRRALAQVELARGELEAASDLIDSSRDAIRSERALAAKVAFRMGDLESASARALSELDSDIDEDEHPWDVAGSYQQFAQVLVDLGDGESAEELTRRMGALLRGAPDDLPLIGHLRIVLVGIIRLQGRLADALDAVDELISDVEGSDLAEALRERARVQMSLGNVTYARTDLEQAIQIFEHAGELWEAQRTRSELVEST